MAKGWRFDRFTFEPAERRLRAAGVDVALGSRALEVLRVLVEHPGQLVTKRALLDLAWPGLVVEENNLQVQVSALRRALGAGAIATVAGSGYRFDWAVSPIDAHAAATSPRPPPRPVPQPLFPLIGRDADLAALLASCREHRLVTVAGSAGIGKTRLAASAALELVGSAERTVAFCDMTRVAEPSLVPQAIALAAGVEVEEGDALEALLARIQGDDWLFVIDNAEHLRVAVAEAVVTLLERAARARALVTSQVPLEVPGERVFRLEPLPVPDRSANATDAGAFGAVALFVAYATAADHRFALTESNVAAVVASCARLDGIPLALQLAAARLPQLGIDGLFARLDQRFRVLSRPESAVPSRQRTLAAALDWSYRLLEPDQQRVLRRLGSFAGPFELRDASAVMPAGLQDELSLLDRIGQLLDRSLIVATPDTPRRYRLLESVRMYALERLLEAGEHDALERAIEHLEQRAGRAAAASRGTAAAIDYAAALELCARLPAGSDRDSRELALQLKLGPAVQASSSPGCRRCEAIYGRAVELARRGDDGVARFQALWGYWHFLAMAGRDRDAAGLTPELTALADTLADDGYQLEACHARFSTAQLLGDAGETLRQTQAAIRLYSRDRHHALTHVFGGHDPGVCAFGQGSIALWLTGDTGRALAMAAEAERLGASFDHAYTQAVGHFYAAMTYAACGETGRLARSAAALVGVSERHGMAVLRLEGDLYSGRADFERENLAGIDRMSDAYDEIVASGDFGFAPYYAALLADAWLSTGAFDAAAGVLSQALAVAEQGQEFFLPELFRLSGGLAAASGRERDALDWYAKARDLAAKQGARSLALRASLHEARLLRARGSATEARALLREALHGWPPDDESRDARAVRGLLDEADSSATAGP